MIQPVDHTGIETAGEHPPRLLHQVREAIRTLHYSRRTEESYVHWIRRFIFWTGKRHPATMGATEVSAFLSHLATEREVAAATQNQALSALLFLYKHVLQTDLPWLDDMVRAKRPVRLPVVLAPVEAAKLLDQLRGVHWLMASLLYGAGLRLMECLRLRVKDVDLIKNRDAHNFGNRPCQESRVLYFPFILRKVRPADEAFGPAPAVLRLPLKRTRPAAG